VDIALGHIGQRRQSRTSKLVCQCGCVWLAIGLHAACFVGGCRNDAEEPSPPNDGIAALADGGTPSERNIGQLFTDITSEVNLAFVHENGADGSLLMPEIMASGVALLDYDGDGDLDVYFTNGQFGLGGATTTKRAVNKLFRQERDGRFVDVTDRSGLGDTGYGMGVAIGDIDNDGDVDVYLANLGADQLYRNRGDGTFENITQEATIHVDGWSSSAAFFDYDRDGFLDLYVTGYVLWRADKECFSETGAPEYCGPKSFPPIHDTLLHNNGDGTFSDVSERAGMSAIDAAGLGVVCDDWNDDGWPDIYVANDAYANQLWINQQDGTFHDDALLRGAAFNLNGLPEAGMGVVSGDFDNDGDLDLFMTHLDRETNTLYRNDGRAGFADATGTSGLAFSSVAYTGFGVAAFDVELDGDLDIFVVNGRVYHEQILPGTRLPAPWNRIAQPNLFYLNDGKGRFETAIGIASAACAPVEISRGLAVGDLDSDGDLDMIVTNIKSPARVYRNDATRSGHWLLVRAIDPRLQRDAIGARISVCDGDGCLIRTISAGSSYQSAGDTRAHFGLGRISKIDHVEVRWPDGLQEKFFGLSLDSFVVLQRGTGKRTR